MGKVKDKPVGKAKEAIAEVTGDGKLAEKLAEEGNFISVRDEHDKEIAQVPLASTTV